MNRAIQDASLPIDVRVDRLLSEMTLEEKVAQLTSVWAYEVLDNGSFDADKAKSRIGTGIGQITRLGGATNLGPQETAKAANEIQKFLLEQTRLQILVMVYEESCSGYMAKGATCFPQTIGIASTWEADVAKKVGEVIRTQMRAAGAHQALAPLLDVTRDPRRGRVEEIFGEDPFLVAQMGMTYVRGLQGEHLREGVVATGRHFVGYGISEGGMNWAPAHIPEREMREVYLYPFEAVVREAALGSIMPGYHELDGVPCHHSKHLLVDILRDTWCFDGIVVSDYFAIHQLYEYHRVAKSKQQAAAFAVAAGVDVELPSKDVYDRALMEAVENGAVAADEVDVLVRRVLSMKFQLGLFEDPYVDAGSTWTVFDNAEQRQLARETARKSIVLLKNENSLLPLSKSTKNLAVIGPNGNNIRNLIGDYAYPYHIESLLEMRDDDNVFDTPMPEKMEVVDQFVAMRTIFEAIQNKVERGANVNYLEGCDVASTDDNHLDEAIQLYAHDAEAEVTRPVLDLRGFARVPVKAGESKRVTFTLSANQLGFYNRALEFVVEPGEIEVHMGAASDDIRLNGTFHITGHATDVEQHKVFFTPVRIG